MKRIITFIILFVFSDRALAQGCVAIRGTGAICTMNDQTMGEGHKEAGKFQLNVGYRYFKSYKHFRGKHEEEIRVENGTEVINWQHTMDLSLLYRMNDRWSFMLGMPLVANRRSSLYEHGGKERHETSSFGLSDMRLVAYRWMLNPAKSKKGNVQLGMGFKFATGNYNYQDYFYQADASKAPTLKTVDQSIQPGDGGTGIITELNGFYNINRHIGLYTNLFYMANPMEINGTLTYRSNKYEQVMSVADQYMARIGANYVFSGNLRGVSTSLGMRIEGIPVEDLLGGSLGFRRPGYVVAVEPGINYVGKKTVWSLTVPIAAVRNRTQSVPDKQTTAETGVYRHGDAAFADYSVNLGVSFRL